MTESEIFAAAAAEPSPEQRQRLLDELCASQPEVKGRIETLLKAHDRAEAGFLRGEGRGPNGTQLAPPVEDLTSTRIGHYKLLQKLGEGGFGVVYMAEQQEPVRRKVAFKVIRPGMDSHEVIARFESERQALALMDHPNIAQVFDAGTSPRGQPYFVMELVRGVPITDYCDRNRLPVADRLKLCISVCQAVQHAHHKGVIHRDIKPSNVMVTLHDGVPVVKVIDFGVAKATSQRLTEKTLFTQYGQMVGTPAYMSPEQAEMSGLDIDTRSDVYSLGVLLYELLTGSTPLEDRQLREAGWARLQQLILDHEPPLPSLRVSSRGGEATVLANNRGVDLRHLTSSLRGDLDWIVMKSLEKDRNRRYVTPSSLAAEIDRYLQGEAIEARAPSLAYRAQRLFRKHRPLVLTGLVITGCLLTATVISTLAALRATEAERVSDQKRREAEESRAALQTSLEETQTARREAESLTSQVIAGQMTSNFDEALLLHWLDQLPRLSDSQRATRQYVKHCLLGALQTMASLGSTDNGTAQLIGYEFTVDLRVLAFDQGLMAFTQTGTDVTIARIATGEVVYQSSRPGQDWGKLATVEVTPECVLITASNGKFLGLDRNTWRPRYMGETPFINPDHNNWSLQAYFDWKHNSDRSLLVGRFGTEKTGGFVILETATGTCQQLPLPSTARWDLNPAGDRLVVVLPDPNRLEVWNTSPPQRVAEFPFEEEGKVTSVEFLLGGSHLLVVREDGNEKAIGSAIWRVDGSMPSVMWQSDGGVTRGTSDDIIWLSSPEKTCVLVASPSGLKARKMVAKVTLANDDWLVDDSNEVYSRETLQPEPRPSTRGYSPHLQEFAIAGRYLHSGSQIVDLTLNLTVPGGNWEQFEFDSTSGHVLCGNPGYFQMVLPVDPDTLSQEQLAALVQLVVCGEREANGQFRPWSENEWQSRLQQAEAHGWLDVTRFPHLVAYLKQSAFWWKHEITRPRPGVTDPMAAEQQINQAWRELLNRDSSLAGQLKCLEKIRRIEDWSTGKWRAEHLRLARQFGREYWEERWSRSVDLEEAAQEPLTDRELSNLAEYLDLRRAFLRQYAATLAPVIPGPYDALGDSLVLIRQGEPKPALQVIEPFLAEWEEQSPKPSEDSIDVPYLQGLQALEVVAHARQQHWAECRAALQRLDRRLPPLNGSTKSATPSLETSPNPPRAARSTFAQRLEQSLFPHKGWSPPGPPVLLLNLLDESLTQLESQGQPPAARQPPASP